MTMMKALKELIENAEGTIKGAYEKGYSDGRMAKEAEIVRCKECVHHKNAPKTTDVWCERIDGLLQKDWFCADGERKEITGKAGEKEKRI